MNFLTLLYRIILLLRVRVRVRCEYCIRICRGSDACMVLGDPSMVH